MVQSRFATYYENHPETNDISLILETGNHKNNSSLHSDTTSKKETAQTKNQLAEEWDYLKKSIDMKLELALLYLNRSNSLLQSL